MTTATHTMNTTAVAPSAPPARAAAISRLLTSEWTKLRTLPSTWRTAVIAVTVSIGLGAILCISQAHQWATMTAADRATFDPTACSLGGFFLVGAVLLGTLGLRSVTAEYATGMIRSTFTATPTRRRVLAAKAAVAAAFAFPVSLLAAIISFEVGQQAFVSKHLQASLGHAGVDRAVIFAALAVSLVAVIGVGLGGLIRHTAGATATLLLVIVGGAVLGQLLPAGLRQYVPGTALEAAVTVHRSAGLLRPDAAITVLGLYAAVALGAALLRVAHRDA
jgi:ABC-2 type transport system permease protein